MSDVLGIVSLVLSKLRTREARKEIVGPHGVHIVRFEKCLKIGFVAIRRTKSFCTKFEQLKTWAPFCATFFR